MKIDIDNRQYEKELNSKNINYIAGVDEVGRGPLVGPVVASCVVLPINYYLEGLTDSKKLTKKKREEFFDIINRDALGVGIGIISEKKLQSFILSFLPSSQKVFARLSQKPINTPKVACPGMAKIARPIETPVP